MGRIVAQVEISNPLEPDVRPLRCSMFVDTGAANVVLPSEWKSRLGRFQSSEPLELVLANQEIVPGEICGPAAIHIEGFRKVFGEIAFMAMDRGEDGEFEPLLGYIPLEQAQVAVDMLGHRLVPVKYVDCKAIRPRR